MLLITLILVAIGIVSLIFGIKFLIKYKAKRNKWHLVLGIVLTFIIPAAVLLLIFRFSVSNPLMVYGPGPMMDYGPGPI